MRSATVAERGNGSFVSRSRTSSIPIISPRPRTSPTVGASASASRRPSRRRAPSSRLRSTSPAFSSPRTARPAAAPSALWDQVKPWTKPGPAAIVSWTRPEAAANPNGTYPPVVPFPAVRMSGRMSQWSMPNHLPVRPNPVITSSAISTTSWRRHTSAIAGQ